MKTCSWPQLNDVNLLGNSFSLLVSVCKWIELFKQLLAPKQFEQLNVKVRVSMMV